MRKSKTLLVNVQFAMHLEERSKNEPMISHEIPIKPWEICAKDLFEVDKETYIAIYDDF